MPRKRREKKKVRIDDYTINKYCQFNKAAYLHVPSDVIWLDWPKQDFESHGFHAGSGGYFCSSVEYKRKPSLLESGILEGPTVLHSEEILGRMRPYDVPKRWHPVPSCPKFSPWIVNAIHVTLQGYQLSIRWGPNYLEPFLGCYVEICMGRGLIWTNSPAMYRQLIRREKDPECFIIENQELNLRPWMGKPWVPFGSSAPRMIDPEPWLRYGYTRDARLQQTGLYIEPTLMNPGCHSQPLYIETVVTRGGGEAYWRSCRDLISKEGERGRERYYADGPLPEPQYVIVQSRKWVWRGLDPRLKFPSPIYTTLLKGRVTTSEDDGQRLGPAPRIINLNPKNRSSLVAKKRSTKKQPRPSSTEAEWICHYWKPEAGAGSPGYLSPHLPSTSTN